MPTSKTPTNPAEKAVRVIKLFGDLTEETYWGNNFRSALFECSDEFIETLEQFIEQCKNDRTNNGHPAATE